MSVVVPAYNSTGYIEECLDSLEAQTIDSLQVVLIDDGSTDQTLRLMEQRERANPGRFTVLRKENGGQATARNLGLCHCTGEYVGFLDSDDYADIDMFDDMYVEAVQSGADMVSCGIAGFRDRMDGSRAFDRYLQVPLENRTIRDLYCKPQVQPCIHLIRRTCLLESGAVFPELRAYEDIAFHLIAISVVERVSQLQRPYVKRRWRERSTVSTITKQQVMQALPSLAFAADYYEKHVSSEERARLLELASLRLLLCSTLGRANLLADSSEKAEAVDSILAFIEERFPRRRDNPLLAGVLGSYLKHAGKATVAVTGPLFAARQRKAMHL